MLPENTTILIWRVEMLANPGSKIVLPPMRANSDNTFASVPLFPVLK
jgi:hypothetical protein